MNMPANPLLQCLPDDIQKVLEQQASFVWEATTDYTAYHVQGERCISGTNFDELAVLTGDRNGALYVFQERGETESPTFRLVVALNSFLSADRELGIYSVTSEAHINEQLWPLLEEVFIVREIEDRMKQIRERQARLKKLRQLPTHEPSEAAAQP